MQYLNTFEDRFRFLHVRSLNLLAGILSSRRLVKFRDQATLAGCSCRVQSGALLFILVQTLKF